MSALEKSQKDETGRRQHTGHNKSHHLSGTNLSGNGATSISSKRSQSQHSAAAVSGTGKSTNPLDSCPTLLRGKEREMPRQKRHSTLKKVRMLNEASTLLHHSTGNYGMIQTNTQRRVIN